MTMPKRIRKVNPAWIDAWKAVHGQGDTSQFTPSYRAPAMYIESEVAI